MYCRIRGASSSASIGCKQNRSATPSLSVNTCLNAHMHECTQDHGQVREHVQIHPDRQLRMHRLSHAEIGRQLQKINVLSAYIQRHQRNITIHPISRVGGNGPAALVSLTGLMPWLLVNGTNFTGKARGKRRGQTPQHELGRLLCRAYVAPVTTSRTLNLQRSVHSTCKPA